MRRINSYGPAFVVLLSAGVVAFAVPGIIRRVNAERSRAVVLLAQKSLDTDDTVERLNRQVRNVASAVEPSVVHVLTQVPDERGERGATGSGWVYDAEGHIVTNAHVVATAEAIYLQFHDSTTTRAWLVGMDVASDIAVLRVEHADSLIPIRRATDVRVQKGDRVYAFGSPFNFKFSMSEGIVSGLGRSARTSTGFVSPANFIQTDAAVNPGNSGGPLVDSRGRLIGMNVAIATAHDSQGTSEGQSAGISFAIPLAMIETRVAQIIAKEPTVGGYVGIFFADAPGKGVLVNRVIEDSPGERAGLKAGDVISGAGGETLREADQLRGVIAAAKPGSSLPLRVVRADEVLDLTVTLGTLPDELRDRDRARVLAEELGLILADSENGPVVQRAFPESPARDAGLSRGQRVVRVDTKQVASAAEAAEAIVSSGVILGKPLLVEIEDRGDDGSVVARSLTLRVQR